MFKPSKNTFKDKVQCKFNDISEEHTAPVFRVKEAEQLVRRKLAVGF
jgi:hypothetical protein